MLKRTYTDDKRTYGTIKAMIEDNKDCQEDEAGCPCYTVDAVMEDGKGYDSTFYFNDEKCEIELYESYPLVLRGDGFYERDLESPITNTNLLESIYTKSLEPYQLLFFN